jgi:transcriptional regulator
VRHDPAHASEDPAVVAELIRANPWATLVSQGESGIVASHYPVLLDEEAAGLTVLTHLGRPRRGGRRPPGATQAPTRNFSVAHC